MVGPDKNTFASGLWIQRCAELRLCACFKCHNLEIDVSLSTLSTLSALSALSFSSPTLLSQN